MQCENVPCWAEHPELAAFYSSHRDRPEDLYPSEQRFLPWLASQVRSVLDTGCAMGGFAKIWRHYQPAITYAGVDVSQLLIDAARARHPDLRFLHGNVSTRVDLPDRYAAVVQALGWLNWEPAYARALQELWRLTDRYLFLDVRLVAEAAQAVIGTQRLALTGAWDGKTTTPYVTVAWPEFAALLINLSPVRVLGYGYWGPPAPTTEGIPEQVCLVAFVLEKRASHSAPGTTPIVCLDLPLLWPEHLKAGMDILPSVDLERLVPTVNVP